MTQPTESALHHAARRLSCEVEALRAVIEVEASGRWLDDAGQPIRRFEPHKFKHRAKFGWTGGWRDYLRTGKAARARMFRQALDMDIEEACRAASWGGPQIMGFNHTAAGYGSAADMAERFQSVDAQLVAFASLIEAWGLAPALAARDWRTFARTYNGSGQVDTYAARMEAAYRRITGHASPVVLRIGDRGEPVFKAQSALASAGWMQRDAIDGIFGPGMRMAVRRFQEAGGLSIDGVIGRETWAALNAFDGAQAPAQPSTTGKMAETIQKGAQWAAAGGAATIGAAREEAAALASDLGITLGQLVLAGAAVAAVAVLVPRVVSWADRRAKLWLRSA